MGIVELLVFTSVYLLCMAIDVVLFFLVVRALVGRWRPGWLVGLDIAGQRLVDDLLLRIDRLWYQAFRRPLPDRGRLAAAITLFYLVWLAVHCVASVFA
ncbi:MAG: hypothetical protein JW993_07605 [Sedimentisphaerales bacterium]|nr:hypothetical protein [Sedimentisphaerales bacterium]